MKKNSLEDLIAIKALKDKREQEVITFELKGEDGKIKTVVLEKPSEKKMYDIIKNVPESATMLEVFDQMIYEAIPELRKPETLEHFECKDNPLGIVAKIFSPADRTNMGQAVRDGVDNQMLERVKN